MSNEIQLVIADDNLFFAEVLAENIDEQKGFNVKKVFSNIDDLILFCDKNELDILVLDVNFNGDSSLEHIEKIRKDPSRFKIIILTSMYNDFNMGIAEKHGVELFLSKEKTFKGFHEIIKKCFYEDDEKTASSKSFIEIDGVKFTDTKINILKSLYKYSGKKEAEIAEFLNISESSLKTHKRQLYEMTNTNRIADLLKFGFENGILLQ